MSTYEYKDQIVAFLDILGFSDIVKEVQNDPKLASEKIGFLTETIRTILEGNLSSRLLPDDQLSSSEPKFKVFSDCICIAFDCIEDEPEYTASSVFSFLIKLLRIQTEFALNDIFVRGAVTVNGHFHNDDIIFSAALINAYSMESKIAIYPRVIVDETVIRLLRTPDHVAEFPYLNEIIKRDVDGLAFIDYLEYYREIDYPEDIPVFLQRHRNILEQNILKYQVPRVKEKYLWSARYHNQKVRKLFEPDFGNELLVQEKLLSVGDSVFDYVVFAFFFTSDQEKIDLGILYLLADGFYKAKCLVSDYISKEGKDYRLIENEFSEYEYLQWAKFDAEDKIKQDLEERDDIDVIVEVPNLISTSYQKS